MPETGEFRIRIAADDVLWLDVCDAMVGQAIAEQLRESGDWLEAVAGIDSVAVRFDAARIDVDAARSLLLKELRDVSHDALADAPLIEIPVCYGDAFGPDFDSLCATLELSPEAFIDLHTSADYRVDMLGFTPGFAYVGGLPDTLRVARLESPRQYVESGSIGIAGGRTGLYAMPGPGGWPLIGRTPLRLFDAKAEQPFLLRAGSKVRFRAIDGDTFMSMAS